MAQGGIQISDSFVVNKEQQTRLQVTGSTRQIVRGELSIILTNLDTGVVVAACGAEIHSPGKQAGITGGFALRLLPGSYKWTSSLTSTVPSSLAGIRQQGNVELRNDGFGIPYGSLGQVFVTGTSQPYVLFSGNDNSFVSIRAIFSRESGYPPEIIGGRLIVKDVDSGAEVRTPSVGTAFLTANMIPSEMPKTEIRRWLKTGRTYKAFVHEDFQPAYPLDFVSVSVSG